MQRINLVFSSINLNKINIYMNLIVVWLIVKLKKKKKYRNIIQKHPDLSYSPIKINLNVCIQIIFSSRAAQFTNYNIVLVAISYTLCKKKKINKTQQFHNNIFCHILIKSCMFIYIIHFFFGCARAFFCCFLLCLISLMLVQFFFLYCFYCLTILNFYLCSFYCFICPFILVLFL